jgi:hypothetical protein
MNNQPTFASELSSGADPEPAGLIASYNRLRFPLAVQHPIPDLEIGERRDHDSQS